MGMEPFDYLTYKRNKTESKTKKPIILIDKKERGLVLSLCIGTFVLFFIAVMFFIASKTAKMDIEYNIYGGNSLDTTETVVNEDNKEEVKPTIDKRLFLIQQEENGPSESRVITKDKDHSEVISKEQFEEIKSNREEVIKKAEKQEFLNQPQANEAKNEEVIKPTIIDESKNIIVGENKISIKPRLPLQPQVKQMSELTIPVVSSKVLVGRFATIEEAREAQKSLSTVVAGVYPFVKKINDVYSVQVGAFESFDAAKQIAGKLKSRGFDVWILQ